MAFKISYYRNGKTIIQEYTTLAQAEAAAQLVFERCGIVVGIEAI